VQAGCSLGDFVSLSEDVRLFCEARLLCDKGRISDSIPLLKRALDLQCDEQTPSVRLRLYGETYYNIRLELNDFSCIEEEFEFFQSDVDTLVHTGRVEVWIKALAANNQFSQARRLIERIDAALQQLAKGLRTPRFFAQQSSEWYSYKREQFAKSTKRYTVKGICEACNKAGGSVSKIESGQWVCRSCLREIHGGKE
jgi:ribosomal protein L37AE/L43A